MGGKGTSPFKKKKFNAFISVYLTLGIEADMFLGNILFMELVASKPTGGIGALRRRNPPGGSLPC